MRKIINKLFFWRRKKAEQEFKGVLSDQRQLLLASIGLTYVRQCKRDRNFRRKMERTEFGQAVIKHLKAYEGGK